MHLTPQVKIKCPELTSWSCSEGRGGPEEQGLSFNAVLIGSANPIEITHLRYQIAFSKGGKCKSELLAHCRAGSSAVECNDFGSFQSCTKSLMWVEQSLCKDNSFPTAQEGERLQSSPPVTCEQLFEGSWRGRVWKSVFVY